MDDVRNIIGKGQNSDGSKWYILSDRSKDGRQYKGRGQKVTIRPNPPEHCDKCNRNFCAHLETALELENIVDRGVLQIIYPYLTFSQEKTYACSCREYRTAGDCIHIQSLKHTQQQLTEQKGELLTQKKGEIDSLRTRIQELEGSIQEDDTERRQLQTRVDELQLEYSILEEEHTKLEQQAAKANNIALSLTKTKFAALYDLPKDIQAQIKSLADLPPDQIKEALKPLRYLQIPTSEKDYLAKIHTDFYNHHQPPGFTEFVHRIARINTIDTITFSWQESAKETRIKKIYAPEEKMPNNETSHTWTIHLLYTNNSFSSNLYLKTTARDQEEAELVKETIEKHI
ncbi:hypothetical protein KY319_02660 [Candidatus Woesearchaeota archaeon]|nr:hypothetical protein [Candidatus Woesearchaeota archaeon]